MPMEIKSYRDTLTLTEKDLIMDNGACFQLVTQHKFSGWHQHPYLLSKATCNKLIKEGKLVLAKEAERLKYYRINE